MQPISCVLCCIPSFGVFCVMFIIGFVLFITFFYGRNVIARIIYIIGSFSVWYFFFAEIHFCHLDDKICESYAAPSPSETNERGNPQNKKNEKRDKSEKGELKSNCKESSACCMAK